MIPIHITGKEAKIRFNREFYDMFPITEVCRKFEKFAKIRVRLIREFNVIEVSLKPKIELEPKELALEFSNHVLHEQLMTSK